MNLHPSEVKQLGEYIRQCEADRAVRLEDETGLIDCRMNLENAQKPPESQLIKTLFIIGASIATGFYLAHETR